VGCNLSTWYHDTRNSVRIQPRLCPGTTLAQLSCLTCLSQVGVLPLHNDYDCGWFALNARTGDWVVTSANGHTVWQRSANTDGFVSWRVAPVNNVSHLRDVVPQWLVDWDRKLLLRVAVTAKGGQVRVFELGSGHRTETYKLGVFGDPAVHVASGFVWYMWLGNGNYRLLKRRSYVDAKAKSETIVEPAPEAICDLDYHGDVLLLQYRSHFSLFNMRDCKPTTDLMRDPCDCFGRPRITWRGLMWQPHGEFSSTFFACTASTDGPAWDEVHKMSPAIVSRRVCRTR
jgi:hypothetical protein